MQAFMVSLLTCSVTMSALALIYLALMPIIARRYSEKGRYYAWLIIIIGLIIPFRPQWGNPFVKVDIPSNTVAATVTIGNGKPLSIPIANPIGYTAPNPNIPVVPTISWWQIAMAVWFAGFAVFIAYNLLKHYRFTKMAKRWNERVSDDILNIFQDLKGEMGIIKSIELYLSPCVSSPMMIGIVKPRIFLPVVELDQDELRFILKHELIHYKRRDLLYRYLVLIANAVHWFNPIVYLLAKSVSGLCEMSCDAEVVQNTDTDIRQCYSETIISVVKYKSKFTTALSTSFYGGKDGMKKRISTIMNSHKKKMGMAIIIIVLLVTCGSGIAIFANVNKNQNLSVNGTPSGTAIMLVSLQNKDTGDNGIAHPAGNPTASDYISDEMIRTYFKHFKDKIVAINFNDSLGSNIVIDPENKGYLNFKVEIKKDVDVSEFVTETNQFFDVLYKDNPSFEVVAIPSYIVPNAEPETPASVAYAAANPSKTIQIVAPSISGIPQDGYWVSNEIMTSEQITIDGPADVLDGINSIELPPIQVDGASSDISIDFNILDYLKDTRVSLVNNVSTVNVTVKINKEAIKQLILSIQNISVVSDVRDDGNLPFQLPLLPLDPIPVTLQGPAETISDITAYNINAILDLTGLIAGTHDVALHFDVPANVSVVGSLPTIHVVISEQGN